MANGESCHRIDQRKIYLTKVQYIHDNPVRAGWVSKPEDWIYSSARNYRDEHAILKEVICLMPPLNFKTNHVS